MNFKLRLHAGGLTESLATVREIAATREALALEASLFLGRIVYPHEITVKPVCYDPRTMWDTHIVLIEGVGPLGYTDGPLP
jgi:hypothetical protein